MRRVPIIIVFLLSAYISVRSQHFVFNRLTISDGLLSNNIRAIWQDKKGFIWLGTESGLQRYDGYRFRTILNARVEQILADKDGRVWIRSGRDIGILNTQSFLFTPVRYEGRDEVYSLSDIWLKKDASENIYLLLNGKNCQYYNEKEKNFSVRYTPFRIDEELKIFDVAEDKRKDRYWIISSRGLGYWDKKTKKLYTASNNEQQDPLLHTAIARHSVTNIFIDQSYTFWFQQIHQTIPFFYSYDGTQNRITTEADGLNHPKNNDYFEVYGFKNLNDSTTAIFGLNYFRIKERKHFYNLKYPINNPYGIHFNSVSDVLQDREGTIWIATDNGLYYTSNVLTNPHIIFNSEADRTSISSLFEDSNKDLWIASWGRGVFVLNLNDSIPYSQPLQRLAVKDNYINLVWTSCEDNNKNIWSGCEKGRLVQYNVKNKTATLFIPSAFKNNSIRQIVKDKKGLLWVGLQDGRIFMFDPYSLSISDKSFREICTLPGTVTKMTVVNKQNIWISIKGKGIYILNTDDKKVIHTIDIQNAGSIAVTTVKDILQVEDTLCLVAGEGMGMINTNTYRVNFELPFHTSKVGMIYTMQKDKEGFLWIGGTNGIFKLNFNTGILSQYYQQDGLLTVHNNSYVPERSALFQSGMLAIGGNQHLVIFNPAMYNHATLPPDIMITGFQINDKYLPEDSISKLKEISIPYKHRAFTVEFSTLYFRDKGRITYEYKLEGFDKKWNIQNTPAPVKYNFLPHGKYRFLVRARNEQGDYTSNITFISLYITPPFWKTTWFYLLLILLTIAILFYLHRLRLQKLLHIEQVRNRLARDLHDDMGSTLSTINILSNMALQQSTFDAAKSKEYMNTISNSTSQMMESMDDIVWSINPANDSTGKIITRMKETAGLILEPRQIDYRFHVHPSVPEIRLSMEARREIFLIFKEAINNIVKYADCKEVEFTLTKNGSLLILEIKDNGKGFQTSSSLSSVRGNGLKNMEKRATNLKGKLIIDTGPGKGTRIKLSIPIA